MSQKKSGDQLIQKTLIDNSTYFSFKYTINEAQIDASLVYNMANFLESLVCAESIVLAPTSAWRPDQTDLLFKSGSVCSQYSFDNMDNDEISKTFVSSIESSLSDIEKRELGLPVGSSAKLITNVRNIFLDWRAKVSDDPQAFIDTYSGAVFFTDVGTSQFVASLGTDVSKSESIARHIAQYLLRTNVALEILDKEAGQCIAYHPHSHRAGFVFRKLSMQGKYAMSLASTILREAETEVTKKLEEKKAHSLASKFGAFQVTDPEMPLVLAVALSGASSPEEIIHRGLDLRNLEAAKRYRKWIAHLLSSIRDGDQDTHLEVEQELLEARRLLREELNALYGRRSASLLQRIASVAGAVDLEKLADVSARDFVLEAASEDIKGRPSIFAALERYRLKRKLALIITLGKQRRPIDNLNLLLEKVFKKRLSDDEKAKLSTMLKDQGRIIKDFSDFT
jgi:hypothetical protein